LAERQVVEESGNEKQGDETKSKNWSDATTPRLVVLVSFKI
jgi:hypothetical protein